MLDDLFVPTPPAGATTKQIANAEFVTNAIATSIANLLMTTGVWTPAFTFDTPGNLAVVYGNQEGDYTKINNLVFLRLRLIFTATFTSASGLANITGFPVVPLASPSYAPGSGQITNLSGGWVWPAGNTMVMLGVRGAGTSLLLQSNGSGGVQSNWSTANLTNGSSHTLVAAVVYISA